VERNLELHDNLPLSSKPRVDADVWTLRTAGVLHEDRTSAAVVNDAQDFVKRTARLL
jgi:hypothetical protein